MKDGVLQSEYKLQKRLSKLGRDEEEVDYVLPDVSSSRIHAAVAYDSIGRLHIADQGSANGTFLNRKRIEAGKWILLKSGSCLKFGADERQYSFIAPPNWEDKIPSAESGKFIDETMVLSGEEAEATAEGNFPFTHSRGMPKGHWLDSLDMGLINEKERDAIARLRQKQQKLLHAGTESARILAKEGNGLSDGQVAQLEKLENTVAMLKENIEEESTSLRSRLEGRRPGCTGLPPNSTTTTTFPSSASGRVVGRGERELDSACLGESEEVVDVSRPRGILMQVPRKNLKFAINPGGGGAPRSVTVPPPSTTTKGTNSDTPLETLASLSVKLSIVEQRLEDISMERQRQSQKGLKKRPDDDSLDNFLQCVVQDESSRLKCEEAQLREEKSHILSLLAIVRGDDDSARNSGGGCDGTAQGGETQKPAKNDVGPPVEENGEALAMPLPAPPQLPELSSSSPVPPQHPIKRPRGVAYSNPVPPAKVSAATATWDEVEDLTKFH